jgi:ribonuclease R
MKNNRTKKALAKFSKRNTHKRRGKEKAAAELMRAIAETGVGTDSLKLTSSYDRGRRGRVSDKMRRDETVARGVFSSSRSGFGFVTLEEGCDKDIFIPEDKTGGALEGDLVEIIYHVYNNRYGDEKTEGRVRKIVEYGRKTVIGTVSEDLRFRYSKKRSPARLVLIPDDNKFSVNPIIRELSGAAVGDKVEVLIDRNGKYPPECEVIRDFGKTDSKEANYEAILAECEIPVDFSKEELAEAAFFAALPLSDEGRVRRDKDVIFTIDGIGAKDLDDAVSLKKLKGGIWQLGVHIADVSHYVKERTHLDRAVMARGTSVYFTDKVVPMLPPALSNGACSLNPGEDKYALSAIINLSADGEILSCRVEPTVIRSRVRGVYSEVNELFSGEASSEIKSKYKEVLPSLMRMNELYLILKKRSEMRGALELETSEAEILLSESGEPVDIIKRERGDAEKLIEQFMLCADEAVATLLTEKQFPCVYRIHENPPHDKLQTFLQYVYNLGISTSGISDEPDCAELSALLGKAKEMGIGQSVSRVLLRTMSKARYSNECSRHYGLGIEKYCHFTSPIRRLSDLATHRMIGAVLLSGERPEKYRSYALRASRAASESEIRAMSAERKIESLYKTVYMSDRVGECFDAVISSVTKFGLFAELENTCEGLIPTPSLDGYFLFDENKITLSDGNRTFRIGDCVKICVEEADIASCSLTFSLCND